MMAVVFMAMLLAVACGADPNDRTASDDAPANSPEGAYQAAGCSSCHGQDGEGGVGPALAGHTDAQVEKQVRDPVGDMPAFGSEKLSDQQLALIVTYIEGLEGEGHQPGGERSDTTDGDMDMEGGDEHMDGE